MRSKLLVFVAASLMGATAQTANAQTPESGNPYARYVDAGQCAESGRRMIAFYWHDKRRDTMPFAPAIETWPAIVRDSLRLCAARFPVATATTADILPLLELMLGAGDTAGIRAVDARIRALGPTLPVAQRAQLLKNAVSAFIEARPAQFAKAREYVRALDALGASGAGARVEAHRLVGWHAWSIGEVAIADSESAASITAAAALGRPEQFNYVDNISDAYLLRADALNIRRGRVAAEAMLDTAANVVVPLTQAGGPEDNNHRSSLSSDIERRRYVFRAQGTVAKPIRADWWIGAAGDTVFPRGGRVTLAVTGMPGAMSFPMAAMIRRLHDSFAARGLDVVFMTYTMGAFRTQLTPESEDEARILRGWFADYMHLGATVAVEESQFSRLSDGRRKNNPMTNTKNYTFAEGVLIGKDGMIRIVLGVDSRNEQVYRQLITAALAQ